MDTNNTNIARSYGGTASAVTSFSTKKDNATMDQSDFLKLMVAQLQNQDFKNPMDNSAMITQMSQLSNIQMMQEMADYSKTNYAISLVGKTVTAARFAANGTPDITTGVIDKAALVDKEYVFFIGDKQYKAAEILSIQANAGK